MLNISPALQTLEASIFLSWNINDLLSIAKNKQKKTKRSLYQLVSDQEKDPYGASKECEEN